MVHILERRQEKAALDLDKTNDSQSYSEPVSSPISFFGPPVTPEVLKDLGLHNLLTPEQDSNSMETYPPAINHKEVIGRRSLSSLSLGFDGFDASSLDNLAEIFATACLYAETMKISAKRHFIATISSRSFKTYCIQTLRTQRDSNRERPSYRLDPRRLSNFAMSDCPAF